MLYNRVGGNNSLLSHHRACRSAHGGSVLCHILFQRFCFSNLRLPAFDLIYASAALHINSEQNIFYYAILNRSALPIFPMVLWLLPTSCSSLLLRLMKPSARPHGINQYSFLVYPPDLRIWVTVTFWTSLPFANLSAKYAFVSSFCP